MLAVDGRGTYGIAGDVPAMGENEPGATSAADQRERAILARLQ
jgi:hypothetical protein